MIWYSSFWIRWTRSVFEGVEGRACGKRLHAGRCVDKVSGRLFERHAGADDGSLILPETLLASIWKKAWQTDLSEIHEQRRMQRLTVTLKSVFDPTLVRGMSYYTGTIFEIEMADFGSSVGGRWTL